MTKLRDYFDEMVVYKDLRNNSFFSSLGLPAFLRDYLLKTFSDEYGNFDMQQVSAFVKKYIPKKEDWMSIKNRIVYENQQVQLLTRISIDINIKTGEISFAIPDFGVSEKETMIEPSIWETYKDELVKNGETWGIIKLGYRPPDDTVKPRLSGKIKLVGFKNFCPYTVDLDYYIALLNALSLGVGAGEHIGHIKPLWNVVIIGYLLAYGAYSDADGAASVDRAVLNQSADDRFYGVGGDGEAETLDAAAEGGYHLHVGDADDLTAVVKQRAAGVALIDGCVGLDKAHNRAVIANLAV